MMTIEKRRPPNVWPDFKVAPNQVQSTHSVPLTRTIAEWNWIPRVLAKPARLRFVRISTQVDLNTTRYG